MNETKKIKFQKCISILKESALNYKSMTTKREKETAQNFNKYFLRVKINTGALR